MRRWCLVVILLILGIFREGSTSAETEVERVLESIVKVQATIPETARTAATIGTEREGSGVLIDTEGHILTIGYLILEADDVTVAEAGGRPIKARIVGYDIESGFGLLQATAPLKAPPMQLGRSAGLSEGDPLLVAGHGGQDAVRGVRIVSLSEFAGSWEYLLEQAIFTAPAHADFSGAALIDRDGRLAGIGALFSQMHFQDLGPVPTNIFVPIDLLQPILADLLKTGRRRGPVRPWLGIRAEGINGRVFVLGVSPEGPSERAGIKAGDLVLTVKEQAVDGLADFYRKVWALGSAGVEVPLGMLQGIEIRRVIVHPADRNQYLRTNPKRTAFYLKSKIERKR